MKVIYNIKKVSDYLKISVSGTRKLVKNGMIPYFRIGKLIRFDKETVDLWIEEMQKR